MLSDQDQQFLRKNRTGIFVAAFFVLLGILFMTLGFLKTMFVIMLGVAGWFAGRVAGDKELIRRFLNNYLGK
jgi:uncharacterized membrane protein